MRSKASETLTYAKVAYYNQTKLEEYLSSCGGRLIEFINNSNTDTQGYVAEIGGEIMIGFRGTEILNPGDWKIDLDRKMVHDPMTGGKIHRGFDMAFSSVIVPLMDSIGERQTIPIRLYGHSLGAAIAAQAAYFLVQAENRNVTHIGLVGCPKIGDALFAAQYNKALYEATHNYVNCCDVVPRVPFWNHPIGQIQYIDSDRSLHREPSSLFKFYDRVKGRIEHGWRVPSRGISDHFTSSYEEAMR